jgi:hypothetical protein
MKTVLAAAAGFILAAWIFHLPAVKAQVPTPLHLTITPVSMGGMNFSSVTVLGTFVAFSCVPDEGDPGNGVCYVASR